jgi:hypothetical protein
MPDIPGNTFTQITAGIIIPVKLITPAVAGHRVAGFRGQSKGIVIGLSGTFRGTVIPVIAESPVIDHDFRLKGTGQGIDFRICITPAVVIPPQAVDFSILRTQFPDLIFHKIHIYGQEMLLKFQEKEKQFQLVELLNVPELMNLNQRKI